MTHGFFGDIIFASSIAKKLKEEKQFTNIDYVIGFPQLEILLSNNPYIDNVFITPNCDANTKKYEYLYLNNNYDKIIKLKELSFLTTPTFEYQTYSGVSHPSNEYEVYTSFEYDDIAHEYITNLKKENDNKPVLAVLSNWEERSFLFTKEEYDIGIDIPNLGYGGKHRNINFIINNLSKDFLLIEVGMPNYTSQYNTIKINDNDTKSVLFESSLIKFCDYFIGTEGGLCNIAAGVGTKTIITGDFVHQLYGYNGVIKKIKEPKLGPKYYFNNNQHVELNPYLNDSEVSNNILKIIKNK
jgi:hypothetical protein